VLVRAVGPTLAAFGVTDALKNPVLSVYQAERSVATNGAWAGDQVAAADVVEAFDRAGAFRFLDETTRDNAVVLTLAPGAYTAEVKSADGSLGAVLLEVYDLQ
jgi:hypothetical protein